MSKILGKTQGQLAMRSDVDHLSWVKKSIITELLLRMMPFIGHGACRIGRIQYLLPFE